MSDTYVVLRVPEECTGAAMLKVVKGAIVQAGECADLDADGVAMFHMADSTRLLRLEELEGEFAAAFKRSDDEDIAEQYPDKDDKRMRVYHQQMKADGAYLRLAAVTVAALKEKLK